MVVSLGGGAYLITGLGIFAVKGGGMSVDIYVGALLGVIMFTNVWLVIWPNQKVIIASATQVANGGAALPEAADALAKAGLASRTNFMFSVPMLFFMGASAHYPHPFHALAFILAVAIILVLTYNGAYPMIKNHSLVQKLPAGGILKPIASIRGAAHCGAALTVILFLILDLL